MAVSELDLGIVLGKQEMLSKALFILSDSEWHTESRNFMSMTEDLHHDPAYCWACQLGELLVQASKEPA
jgi:hypothetical protein